MLSTSESAFDARARRVARSAGYAAHKSRLRVGSVDNLGEFMLIDLATNFPVAGFRYDMSAGEVVDWCLGH